MTTQDPAIIDRAMQAYFRSPITGTQRLQPDHALTVVETVDDIRHVFLRNVNGTIAVYREHGGGRLGRVHDDEIEELDRRVARR